MPFCTLQVLQSFHTCSYRLLSSNSVLLQLICNKYLQIPKLTRSSKAKEILNEKGVNTIPTVTKL